LDALNLALLDRLQRFFPLVPEPYRVLGEGLSLGEYDVRERIKSLKEQRVLRQISAIFNTGALGYRSSLVGMAVPEDALERAASAVNAYPGVSHNYLRPGSYNMWFTIAVPPGESLERTVDALAGEAGEWPTLILPAVRKYKLAVVLDVLREGEGEAGDERPDQPPVEATEPFQFTEANVRAVRRLQEDLPLEERPFAVVGEELGLGEADVIGLMKEWLGQGIMRRFAAVLNHRQMGFGANGMIVWRCPDERIDACGRILASHAEVSHCYHRPAYAQWPYNLYAMVHGRTVEECRRVAEKLAEAASLPDYQILFSTREFKKIRLKLFWDR